MNKKLLRVFVLPLILFFALSTVTAPARAILPVIAAGVSFVAEGGAVANGMAALTVGTVAGMIYLSQNGTGAGSTAGSIMDIPLGVGRDRPLETPTDYTAPVNNNAQPAPPSSVPPINVFRNSYAATTYSSRDGAAAAACSQAGKTFDHYGTPSGDQWPVFCTGSGNQYGAAWTVQGCSAGYTVSGSSCALSDAALVLKPADGRCQVLASVSGFAVDPQDPECGQLASKGINVSPTEIVYGKPGELTNGKIVRNADGSRTVTYSKVNSDNKTTTINTYNFLPADPVAGTNASVTGTSVVVVNGTGSAVTSTPADAASLDFPDDYNREATQGQIKTGVDALHADLDSSGYTMPQAETYTPVQLSIIENKKITDALDGSVNDYNNFKLLDWSTWIPVFPTASCSPFTGSVMGRTVTIDLCPKIAMMNELIGWLFSVFAAWSVVHLLFRKD